MSSRLGAEGSNPGLSSLMSEAASPVGDGPLVIDDLSNPEIVRPGLRSAVRVGIDDAGKLPPVLPGAFDVLLTTRPSPPREWVYVPADRLGSAVRAIRDAVEACPNAASIFCQTLRVGERMEAADGLLLESLAYSTLLGGAEFRRWCAATRRLPPPSVSRPAVLVDRQDDELHILIDRPETHNAMSAEVRDALVDALRLAAIDPSVKRVKLSGAGRAFSTGGELAEFGMTTDMAFGHAIRMLRSGAGEIMALGDRIEIVAHGACIGAGVEIMAAAAQVSASGSAFFQLPEIRMGLIPGAGGTVTLPRRIGRWRTAWMALSGRRIACAQAMEWGLVDKLVD